MIFVDTGAWYSLVVADDEGHQASTEFNRQVGRGRFGRVVTTDYVFDETYTLLRMRKSHEAASAFSALMDRVSSLRVVWIEQEEFESAKELMLGRRDKRWSFTDCTSFVVMNGLGIKDAFTPDHDFEEAGFTIHPKEETGRDWIARDRDRGRPRKG